MSSPFTQSSLVPAAFTLILFLLCYVTLSGSRPEVLLDYFYIFLYFGAIILNELLHLFLQQVEKLMPTIILLVILQLLKDFHANAVLLQKVI